MCPEVSTQKATEWSVLHGQWDIHDNTLTYNGTQRPSQELGFGIALSNLRMRNGSLSTKLTFPNGNGGDFKPDGRLLFGYDASRESYFSAGIGGYARAYVVDEFRPGEGWRAIRTVGPRESIKPDSAYDLRLTVRGQDVELSVNDVTVIAASLPRPLVGDQVGLFAYGPCKAEFKALTASMEAPRIFIITKFGEPFDTLVEEVIKPCAEKEGFRAYRADDVFRPGLILQDIITGIKESELIVAEITPANPNVFYELGYAHAINKPTILLAERDVTLPFDVSGYRVVFYDDTIGGKAKVENAILRHLQAIKRGAGQ